MPDLTKTTTPAQISSRIPARARHRHHQRRWLGPMSLLASLTATATLTACGAETLALAGAAGNAALAGNSVYTSGKAIAAVDRSFEAVNTAVDDAARQLAFNFEIDRTSTSGHRRYVRLRDDRGGGISIRIDRRTPRLTRIEINAGPLGHAPTSRLMLQEVLEFIRADPQADINSSPAPPITPN